MKLIEGQNNRLIQFDFQECIKISLKVGERNNRFIVTQSEHFFASDTQVAVPLIGQLTILKLHHLIQQQAE